MDPIKFYDCEFSSRLLLGTSRYPSPQTMLESIEASGAEVITVSLRRESATVKSGQRFFELLRSKNVRILPNTAGCYSAREAIVTAEMARELFDTPWIKLEVIGDDYTLQPDPFGLVEAAKELIAQGFQVFPYMTDDLIIAEKLVNLGCRVLMPWGSPIGSGRGLCNQHALAVLRKRFPDITMLVDAGIGRPSDATQALELGYDGVLLNTAVATAENPTLMAHAFKHAVEAGRAAFRAGVMEKRDHAVASTPVSGKAVLI